MAKYKPENEGALYTKRKTAPLTIEKLRELQTNWYHASEARAVDGVTHNAIAVLKEHFDERVELDAHMRVVIDENLVSPESCSPEIVRDAFDLINCAKSVRALQAVLLSNREEIELLTHPRINCGRHGVEQSEADRVGLLITRSMQLGRDHERLLLRANGFETAVADRKKTEAAFRAKNTGIERPAEADRMFDEGKSVRAVAGALANGSRRVAERWRREWKEKSSENQ